MPNDRTQTFVRQLDGELRTPTVLEADVAAQEAGALADLLYAASGNSEGLALVNDDSLPHGLLMLIERQQVMAAFIAQSWEDKRKVEGGAKGLKVAAGK